MEVDDEDPEMSAEIIELPEIIRSRSPILEPPNNRTFRRRTRRNIQDTSIISGHITLEDTREDIENPTNDGERPGPETWSEPVDQLTDRGTNEDPDSQNIGGKVECSTEETPKSTKRTLSESDEEEGLICPICLDYWTNSGEHRLTSLKCGHLFGHMCIKRWLRGDVKNRYCPTCKMKAGAKDMRFIFAKKIKVADTTECERLKEELSKITAEKSRLEIEHQVCLLNLQVQTRQIVELKEANFILSSRQNSSEARSSQKCLQIYLEKNIELSSEPGCRVLSYNSHYQYIAASQKSQGTIFPGFGVRLIDMKNFKPMQFVHFGQKQIRDIQFSSKNVDLLLMVSLDKTAKIYDLQKKTIVNTIMTEVALWSCCWDATNSSIFYIGGQGGLVLQYNINDTQTYLQSFKIGDLSPVVSMCSVSSCTDTSLPLGGVLACKLNSCWVLESSGNVHMLPFEGAFTSISYEEISQHVLVSSRPTQKHHKIRHTVAVIERVSNQTTTARAVQEFQGGQCQKLMSRSNQVRFKEDNLIAAFDEEYSGIILWSMKTGQRVKTLPCSTPIMDLCEVRIDTDVYLASLTETALRIYKLG